MPTVTVFAPELTGLSPTLWLTVRGTGVLTNAGGDALTELANGTFEATVAESINVAHDAAIKISGNTVRTGVLLPNDTVIRDCYESATVSAITSALSATKAIAVESRVSGSTITAYLTEDFRVRSGTQLTLTIADAGGTIAAELNAIGLGNLDLTASPSSGTPGQVTGTIASVTADTPTSDVTSIVIEITNCAAGLQPDDFTYQIWSHQTQGSEIDDKMHVAGTLRVLRNS